MVQTCGGCGRPVAMGFLRCPRCRAVAPSFAGRVKEEAVPTITVNDGPSNAGAAPGEVGYIGPAPDEVPAVEMRGEHGPELVDLPDGAPVIPAADYTSMPHAALKDEAKNRGLPVGGSKADLAARLSDHDAAQPSAVVEAALAISAQQEAAA